MKESVLTTTLEDGGRQSIDYLEEKWALGNVTRPGMCLRVHFDHFDTCYTLNSSVHTDFPGERPQNIPMQMFDTRFVSRPHLSCLEYDQMTLLR